MVQKTLDGKNVTIVRDARSSDPGFDPAKPGQVVVKLQDGTEKTVQSTALKDSGPAA